MTRPLAHKERVTWLRLARTPGIGPLTFARLIARHGGPDSAWEALGQDKPDLLSKAPSAEAIEAELAAFEAAGQRLLASAEPDYPPRLAASPAPPPVLAALGDLAVAQRPAVAIVGARDASAAGLMMAERLAAGLSEAGVVVVSGLARGIDARAHGASLSTGTIAAVAGGADVVYPPENAQLHAAIAEHGLIVSDSPLGAPPRAKDFPRRNLIIAGLSDLVIVVEAGARSGALITARAAADLCREVGAVPGSPLDGRTRGSNGLLREGAALVETAEDVLALLGSRPALARAEETPLAAPLAAERASPMRTELLARLESLLSPTPVHVNDLARLSEAPYAEVAAALAELELMGRATSRPGGYASSAPTS